jgi:hypothetical protein
VEWL